MAISGFSNYMENKVLDILGGTTFTGVTSYCSLHTADPDEDGSGTECTGGTGPYARQSITFAAASGGSKSSSATITFTGMPSCTVSHIGIWDASTSGNFLAGGAVTGGSKTVNAGDTFEITSGSLTVTLD